MYKQDGLLERADGAPDALFRPFGNGSFRFIIPVSILLQMLLRFLLVRAQVLPFSPAAAAAVSFDSKDAIFIRGT